MDDGKYSAPIAEAMAAVVDLGALPYRTVEEAVADRIRRAILRGDLRPGTRILQAELAERMGTSITPIRAALRQLAGEGLIHIEPQRSVLVHKPTAAELGEIYEIRLLIEPSSVAKTAAAITAEDLEAAAKILDRMEKEEDLGEWCILNRDFHALLVKASQAPRMTTIMTNLLSLSAMHNLISFSRSPHRIRQADQEHRRILAACQAHDARRAQDMALKHLESSRRIGTDNHVPLSHPTERGHSTLKEGRQ
jgi:DNA-binding GntR family transcriptional regulator